MQPMLHYLDAEAILMDSIATKATNAHPKVINLIRIVNAPAQATNPMPRKSANISTILIFIKKGTRVRCLDCSIRFSQN